MGEVRIGSGNEYLLLTHNESDPIVETVVAEVSSEGLRASKTVVHSYSTGFADLTEFFNQLAADWKGWTGIRSWGAVEGDLDIDAQHEYRHVQLRVTLRKFGPGWGNEGWKVTADLTIDPGEQLSQIAVDLSRLTKR